ncbi:MAG: CAP domain-containing protein [Pseudomonadota bacterium]
MKYAVLSVIALALAGCIEERPLQSTAVNDACTPSLPATYDAEIPNDGSHDKELLARAILAYTNAERCRADVAPLQYDGNAFRAAQSHSDDMARLDFFDHQSPVPGREQLIDRVSATGARFLRARENILTGFYVDYTSGVEYRTLDEANCEFTYGGRTGLIPRHTYATLARSAVASWEQSDGHRRNMLADDVTRHGAGITPTGKTQLCGEFTATQVLLQ